MAAPHAPIHCIRLLQDGHGPRLTPERVESNKLEIDKNAHGTRGWKAETDPLEPTGAQMNAAYAMAA